MYAEYFNSVTSDTRLESFLKRPINPRSRQILYTLGNRQMTARQLAYEMGFKDLNAVKPRLTEMKSQGLIIADAVAYDELTGRNVALWRKA
jgi:hypothetical protein